MVVCAVFTFRNMRNTALTALLFCSQMNCRERHGKGGAVVCLNPSVTRAAGDLLESYLSCLKKAGRVRPDWKPGTAPTSGLVGSLMLLYACEHLSLYGFGGGGRNFSYQLRQRLERGAMSLALFATAASRRVLPAISMCCR